MFLCSGSTLCCGAYEETGDMMAGDPGWWSCTSIVCEWQKAMDRDWVTRVHKVTQLNSILLGHISLFRATHAGY